MKYNNVFVRFFALLLLAGSIALSPFGGKATTAQAATMNTISTWWPVEGRVMTGTQPFKALLEGRGVEDYFMFWQVDGGQWNWMGSNYQDYPHKEAQVDLTNWKWHGNGPYNVNFIATERNGTVVAQKSVNIYTGAPSVPVATPVVVQTSTTPTQTPTASNPAPVPSVLISMPVTTTNTAFYVDPNSNAKQEIAKNASLAPLLSKIADNPVARWFGNWNQNIRSDVDGYVSAAQNQGTMPVLVAYNIPGRDCGNYSAGGAGSPEAYRTWISQMAEGIGNRKAIVVLEPDALPLNDCLPDSAKQTRYALLKDAVNILKSKGNTSVYLDAGHANWISAQDMAVRLNQAGISGADGFSLNVSNFETTSANTMYGEAISKLVNGKHFIIDTSRNGRGGNGQWCNPWGRGLGSKPTRETGNPLVDAYLWVKAPGESDGSCNGGPNAGTWWLDYALDLARNASF